jgi:hypothetical protein
VAEIGTPFVGIGAMRAGTSWLSQVLDSRDDCRMTTVKELHFFDLRYGQYSGKTYYRALARSLRSRSKILNNRMQKVLDRLDTETGHDPRTDDEEGTALRGGPKGWSDQKRAQLLARGRLSDLLPKIPKTVDVFFLRDLKSYAEYVKSEALGAAAFGEITPAYSLLPAAAFAEIDQALPGAHFIFIMRDPVERLWSQERFRTGLAAKRRERQLDPGECFDKALRNRGAIGRSDYHRTITELESVIPKDRILYFFYETMTSRETGPAEIRRLEDGLGLQRANIPPGLFDQPVNASPPATLTRERETAALDLFRPVYDFVEKRFGRQVGWRSA